MARAPRAVVPQTSGQGISRLSYEKGYGLAKNPNAPQVKSTFSTGSSPSRDYGKMSMSPVQAPGMNVSYGDTYDPTNVSDIQAELPKRPPRNPPKGPPLGLKQAPVLK